MVDLRKTRRKIEDIRSDNGKVVDTIAGALLRTFVRLNELDQANVRLNRRVAVLEGLQRQTRPAPAARSTEQRSAATRRQSCQPPCRCPNGCLRSFGGFSEIHHGALRGSGLSETLRRGDKVVQPTGGPDEKQPAQPNGANGGTGIDVFGAPVHLPKPRRPRGRPLGSYAN